MPAVVDSLRLATRRLLRVPAFTLTAVGTLALGIGATTAVFSVVDGILLRPLPYPQSHQLVDVGHALEVGGGLHVDQSDAGHLFYRKEAQVFGALAAYQVGAVNVGGAAGRGTSPAGAERASGARVTASLFDVLRATPAMGRPLADTDDAPGAPPVVVLSDQLWTRSFGRDRSILGRPIVIDGVLHEVVGVMPPRFHFPDAETALWLPSGIDPANYETATFDYKAVGRRRAGVTDAAVQADLQRLLRRLPDEYPGRLTAAAIEATKMRAAGAHARAWLAPVRHEPDGSGRPGRGGAATARRGVPCELVAGGAGSAGRSGGGIEGGIAGGWAGGPNLTFHCSEAMAADRDRFVAVAEARDQRSSAGDGVLHGRECQ